MTVSETNVDGVDAAFTVTMKNIQPDWMIALGVLTVLTGIVAIAFPLTSTLAVELLTGSLFLTVGAFTTVHAIMDRKAKGMWWELLIGLVHIVAGVLFLANPLGGILALTIILGATFMAEGILRIIMATQMERSRHLFLLIASGALSILLGIVVFGGLANGASLTLIGVLLGVNFIFSGTAAIVIGVAGAQSDSEDLQA
ncbi:HdeD family acid-resistance protein [Cognatiyoonia sp. IB215182]|uniref:HdeD family acid-resistance protein n=1 Tax=Cognatiyoonia sp. IB215182 TaxID=3097353 RepID=UPI002A1504C7|nr:HdeD family acid-resistance protein [Cognatiyoonia sp. IB215182]MDX8352439.1 HdeD family acid-resistance protein [Cognatiyoonia sp. IB215182]